MDSRFRGNDGLAMDSRFRGNDGRGVDSGLRRNDGRGDGRAAERRLVPHPPPDPVAQDDMREEMTVAPAESGHFILLHLHEEVAVADAAALFAVHHFHDAVMRRLDRVLHLHRLQNDERLVGLHFLAGFHHHL